MDISNQPNGKPWDVVIIGGGPVGLSAAKMAAEYKLKVIILEQGKNCGTEKRGETIAPRPIVSTIWGSSFLEPPLVISTSTSNMFHSPGDRVREKVVLLETPHSFHWESMIDKMVGIVTGSKLAKYVTISYETEVSKAILPDDDKKPVTSVQTSRGTVFGKTFLDCSGFRSKIGRQLGFDYSTIVNPIIKSVYSGYPIDQSLTYQSYFIAAGDIKPQGPPAMLCIFPNSLGEAEVACQFFDEYGPGGFRRAGDPPYESEYILNYYEELKEKAPGFSDTMKGLTKKFEYLTGMPSRKMITNPMIYPGLVIAGDAAGFLNPKSSSGLVSGMHSALYWIEAAKDIVHDKKRWNVEKMNYYVNQLHKEDFYHRLRQAHKQMGMAKKIVYGLWKNADLINDNFSLVVSMYNMQIKNEAVAVTEDEYKKLDWDKQVATVNAILSGLVVLQRAENKVIRFLKLSKKMLDSTRWELFESRLLFARLFKKLQGADDLSRLYDILGPASRIECAIARNSKFIIVRDVTRPAIRAADLDQRMDTITILLNQRPLARRAQQKLLDIIEITEEDHSKEDLKEMVLELGGKNTLLRYVVNPTIRKSLQVILKHL